MQTIPFEASTALKLYHSHKLHQHEQGVAAQAKLDEIRKKMGDKLPKDYPEDVRAEHTKYWNMLSGGGLRNAFKEAVAHIVISDEEMEQYNEAWRDWYFRDENAKEYHPSYGQLKGAEESLSPDGRYKLVITSHPTSPGSWAYSKGTVYDLEKSDTEPIAVIRRNYGHFWYSWMTHSANGKQYLWCGENYQGYTCVDLEEGTVRNHLPSEAGMGSGFCWVDVEPSPDGKYLAVYGCYWACPYEVQVYEFVDPDAWPLLMVGGMDSPVPSDEGKEGLQWNEDGTLSCWAERLIRKSDGADIEEEWDRDNITDEEYERLEMSTLDPDGEAEYRKVHVVWEPLSTRKLYNLKVDYLRRRREFKEKYAPKYDHLSEDDLLEAIQRLWDRMSTEEREGLVPPG